MADHATPNLPARDCSTTAACYARLGVPERFALLEAGDEHYVTHKLRCATVEWFSRWFLGKTDPVTEPPHEPEPLARLYCTPNGSLRYSGIGETIHGHIVKKQAAFPPARRVPGDAAECAAFRATLVAEIRRLLRCDAPAAPLAVRRIGDT